MKKILENFDKKQFRRYFIFSIILIILILIIGTFNFTQARYETNTKIKIEPQLAFFLVDVRNQEGQIKLDGILPSNNPYIYRFDVSNYYKTQKANVDLKYEIEIITTANIPLTYKVYKGNDLNTNMITQDYFDTDSNGVYYRHLKIDGISYFNYNEKKTDVYTLWVLFPEEYKDSATQYSGVIELVDIKINAEQVM